MAVSPAEDILRTLTYNYTASTGRASYSQTAGIIDGPSATSTINNKISCSFNINCNSYKKNITSNGHYTLTFMSGRTSATRTLSINLKMTDGMITLTNVTFSFINLSAGKYYTLTLDVDGIATIGPILPRLYNMTLVLGSKSYTYDDIFGPIATCSDIFTATGLEDVDSPETPSEVVYAYNSTDTIAITNTSRTYLYTFYIINKPSQTYSNNLAVRYADLKKDTWRSLSI